MVVMRGGRRDEVTDPIPAIIHCPYCHTRHYDVGEWETRPHHKHLCLNPDCGKLFRIEPYCWGATDEHLADIGARCVHKTRKDAKCLDCGADLTNVDWKSVNS